LFSIDTDARLNALSSDDLQLVAADIKTIVTAGYAAGLPRHNQTG
jgi:hypothetical protein